MKAPKLILSFWLVIAHKEKNQFGRYLRRDILKDSPISYYFNNLNFSYHLI